MAKLNDNLLKVTPSPPHTEDTMAKDMREIWCGEKKLTNESKFHCEVFQENNWFNQYKFSKIWKKKMESNVVNHLIAPKRKGINAFNLFNAFYTGKYLLGKYLAVLIYLWLKCLFSEPKHLQFQLGGMRYLFTFICFLILILLPILLSPIPFHLFSCYKPLKDKF